MFPSSAQQPYRRPGRGNRHVDNSVNNYGNNLGSMTGGSINFAAPTEAASSASQSAGRGFDQAGFGVFINYRRREPHAAAVALIHRELVHHFGASRVFLDRSSMEPGARYPDQLWLGLHASKVMLSVIHSEWLDDIGQRQATPAKDWVRFEIEAALKAQKVLIPVLLDGARRLKPEELPDDIRDLAHRPVFWLRLGQHDDDLARLVEAVAPHLGDGVT
jgi:hypothetical protein